MKLYKYLLIPITMWFVAAVSGCTESELIHEPQSQSTTCVERVIDLSLCADACFTGELPSRAAAASKTDESSIKDFWVLEYDAEGVRVGFPRYFEVKDAESTQRIPISIPTSETSQLTGVIIANSHNNNLFNQEDDRSTTIENLKTLYQIVESETDLIGDGDLMMSATFSINYQTEYVRCMLLRNASKIHLSLENQCADLTIHSIHWRNVPERQFYAELTFHPNYSDAGSYSEFYAKAMDQDVTVIDWHTEEHELEQGGKYENDYYLPRSCWGISGDATDPRAKNQSAPEKATYLEIIATVKSSGLTYRYRFYPGKDDTKDFNILPNYSYTLAIVLQAIGNPVTDSRVEDTSKLTLKESNSYIINPGSGISYTIPVSRINYFWRNEKGATSENLLTENTEWVAEVIWQDANTRLIDFCDDNNVAMSNYADTLYVGKGNTSFTVRPRSGVKGNVVVGVRKKEATPPVVTQRKYLWSWHLWVTDYNPDAQTEAWTADVYQYPVDGGCVQRLESSFWNKTYHNKYQMDRNLGAISATSSTDESVRRLTWGNYYQFGRKDPYPQPNASVYNMNGNISVFNTKQGISGAKTNLSNMLKENYCDTYATAVEYPYKFYTTTDAVKAWVMDKRYEMNIWDDPTWNSSNGSEKSLFDPCPTGWKIPDYGVWDSFMLYTITSGNASSHADAEFATTSNPKKTFASYQGYHFYLNESEPEKGESWFPAAACRNLVSIEYDVGKGYYWMSVPANSMCGNRMDITVNGIKIAPNYTRAARATGASIRCVRE